MSDDPRAHPDPQPPERAAPSAWAFRGSIAALVVGSFLALFLVLRPPESESQAESVRPAATAEITAEPTTTPEPRATPRPVATTTPVPDTPEPTPVEAAEPTPAPEPEPEQPADEGPTVIEYTVVEGDTLLGIALDFDTTLDAILEANPGLDPDTLQIGQIILVPLP